MSESVRHVREVIDQTAVARLLADRPAVVLERIARGAGATRWFRVVTAQDLERLVGVLSPGSLVSFYFDDRVSALTWSDEAVVRVLDLVAAHGDAVVGIPREGELELVVEVVAGANELNEVAEGLGFGAEVFVGGFPAAEDDGADSVTVVLPDQDGVVRAHPH